jgi:hypothetical protein
MSRIVKINDKKAPRFRRNKGAYCVISRDLYKRYKEKYSDSTVSYKDFSAFLLEHIEFITNTVVDDRDGIKFPYSIGSIFIGACKPNNNPIDYQKSQEYGVEVKSNNFDTEGLIAKIFFTNYSEERRRFRIAHRKIWTFKPARKFKLKVSKAFKENFTYYKQVNTDDKIWKKVIE